MDTSLQNSRKDSRQAVKMWNTVVRMGFMDDGVGVRKNSLSDILFEIEFVRQQDRREIWMG